MKAWVLIAATLMLGCAGPRPFRPSQPAEGAVARAWTPQRELTLPEFEAFFAWTGSLGLPSLGGASLVRVAAARPADSDEESEIGFLTRADAQRFVVVHGLTPTTYVREAGGRATPSFEELASGRHLGERLDALAPPDAEPRAPLFHFYLARGAHENGFDVEAARLVAVAVRALGDPGPGAEITSRLRELVGRTLLRRLFEQYGSDAGGPAREALRARLAELGPRLGGDAGRRAQEMAGVLAKMIEEDARPRGALPDFVTAGVEGAIHALRDDRRSCLVAPRDPHSAEGRLRGLRYTAVPALLALWDDDRITPCLDRRPLNDAGARAGVPLVGGRALLDLLRYRDVARSILREMAPHLKTRADAETWWANVHDRGLLDDAPATADIVNEASQRVAAEPARGVEATIAAARRAEGSVRLGLVTLLAGAPGDAQRGFLTEEIRGGNVIEARAAAARWSAQRGDAGWAAALVRAAGERLSRFLAQSHSPVDPQWNVLSTGLVDLLLDRASPADMRGLFDLYPRLPLDDRFILLREISNHQDRTPAETADLLRAALDDTSGPAEGWLIMYGTRCWRFSPRDAAALVVAHRLARKYDCTAEHAGRTQQIAALKAEWAKRKPPAP